jgi:hypothetical protein
VVIAQEIGYAILPAAPVAFSDCDSAIAAAGARWRLCACALHRDRTHVAAGLLLPALNDWNDSSQPVARVHARDRDASDEVLAFRAMASITPSAMAGTSRRATLSRKTDSKLSVLRTPMDVSAR